MTDGIRTLARDDRGIDVDVTESFPTFDPVDDGFTRTGNPMEVPETEGDMETTKPSALATAVFKLCAPGGQTPAAMDAVVRAVAAPAERRQAIRLAQESLDQARRLCWEREIALLELTGDSPEYAALLRTYLGDDRDAERRARIAHCAALIVAGRSGLEIPEEMRAEVAERVAALRIERERH